MTNKYKKRLPDELNTKPLEKPHISHYEVYRGKNGDHYIEVSKSGERRYYITKDTPDGTSHTTSTASTGSPEVPLGNPKNIINYSQLDYNTQKGNNDILYGHIEKNNFGFPTGQAAPVDINQLLDIDNINKQLEELRQQISQTQNPSGLHGYKNPLTGNNRIFTREDVESMSNDAFSKYEKEIDAQTKAFNGAMPTNADLQKKAMTGGGVVYVNSYTRSDGTKVRGYYRSKPIR